MPISAINTTWPLLLGMGVLMLGAGLQSSLLGVRATLEGFPSVVTGLIMSCYYVGYLIGTMLAPRLLRRIGHIRAFAALAAIAAAAALAHGAFVDATVWAVIRLTSGLCFAGLYVVAESWLNDRATRETRGRLFALYMVTLYVGLGAAQFLLLAWDPATPLPFMMVSALISLALVPIVLSAHSAPEITLPRRVRLGELYRDSPLGVATVMVSGLISATVFSMGPVYARLSGLDLRKVAAFMSVSILAGVLMQYPVGRISDRMDRRTVIAIVCMVVAGVAGTLTLLRHLPHPLFLLLTAVVSGFALTLYSLAVSHVNDKLEPSQMVDASSALLRINGTAAAFGPVAMGGLLSVFGPGAYFATLASLAVALLLFDLWRKLREQPVPKEQKSRFVGTRPRV
ncbi:MAG: MFS transporter [Gammaproteobacteria bacterium]|nr:MFS transporter [Gammaproteobacteria bacterium]